MAMQAMAEAELSQAQRYLPILDTMPKSLTHGLSALVT
jgi:hypothetical protein